MIILNNDENSKEVEKNEDKGYYFNYGKAIIFLLIILIGLFIYDKHDDWKTERELKKITKEAVESLEKINNRQF